MSSIVSPSAEKCIELRSIWIPGSNNTMYFCEVRPRADLPRCYADDEGENNRALIASGFKT